MHPDGLVRLTTSKPGAGCLRPRAPKTRAINRAKVATATRPTDRNCGRSRVSSSPSKIVSRDARQRHAGCTIRRRRFPRRRQAMLAQQTLVAVQALLGHALGPSTPSHRVARRATAAADASRARGNRHRRARPVAVPSPAATRRPPARRPPPRRSVSSRSRKTQSTGLTRPAAGPRRDRPRRRPQVRGMREPGHPADHAGTARQQVIKGAAQTRAVSTHTTAQRLSSIRRPFVPRWSRCYCPAFTSRGTTNEPGQQRTARRTAASRGQGIARQAGIGPGVPRCLSPNRRRRRCACWPYRGRALHRFEAGRQARIARRNQGATREAGGRD